ncbi:hypothetical protein J4526_01770 [Desulfurococcaceae archaeon MEX13E-LK6-19]|nr:hypothetical protein J4526_01770 [Desulfurococcaceae archaeon MEX13E-LK6-19]
MSLEYRVKYKEQVYGYELGGLLIDVARALGGIHSMLPEYEYKMRLAHARSMMQALLASIPEDVYGSDLNPLETIKDVENMDRGQLLELLYKITSLLDRRGLLVRKKVQRLTRVEDYES